MLGPKTPGKNPDLIHGNGRGKNVPGFGINGNDAALLRAVRHLLRLTVAGKENNDPVILLPFLGQLVAQNLEDVVLGGRLIEQDCGLETEGLELFLHRPSALDCVFEGRPFIVGVDADDHGITLMVKVVKGRRRFRCDLDATFSLGGGIQGRIGQQRQDSQDQDKPKCFHRYGLSLTNRWNHIHQRKQISIIF